MTRVVALIPKVGCSSTFGSERKSNNQHNHKTQECSFDSSKSNDSIRTKSIHDLVPYINILSIDAKQIYF